MNYFKAFRLCFCCFVAVSEITVKENKEKKNPNAALKLRISMHFFRKNKKGINYVWLNKHNSTVEQPVNGEGRERQWSKVMCNLPSQWAVGRPGRPIAGGVREINSGVSSSKIWLIPCSVHCWRCSGCSWSGQQLHRGKNPGRWQQSREGKEEDTSPLEWDCRGLTHGGGLCHDHKSSYAAT